MTNFDRRAFLGTAAVTGVGLLAVNQSAVAQETSTLGKTPHTKFAVNVEMWWTSKRNFLDRVRETAALGFPAIEFWPWQGKDIDALAKLTSELGIAIAQFTAWGFRPGLND